MAYITTSDLREYLDLPGKSAFTAVAATDLLTLTDDRTALSLQTGVAVRLTTTTTLPAPLSTSAVYFAIAQGIPTTLKLATTLTNAKAGTAIDITDTGTGAHSIYRAASDEGILQDCIDDAESYINNETHRMFSAVSATRYFAEFDLEPDGLTLWFPDDLLTITTLTNGDSSATIIPATEYVLYPRNESPPYHGIRLNYNSAYSWEWDTDYWVSVAGMWGWSMNPPGDIRRATLRLAAFYYRQKDSQVFETTAVPEAGVITVPQAVPRDVTAIIAKYRKAI